MTVRTATLNGTTYDIDLCGPVDGLTQDPRTTKPFITICRSLDTKAGLETLLHELSHVYRPNATEEQITQMGAEMARLLWRIGYRYNKRG